jgi:hypothetical protein
LFKRLCLVGCCALVLCLSAATARADVVLTNGDLQVTVRSSDGTIQAIFPLANPPASNFYDPGFPVANFGFQVGTSTGTFAFNSRAGITNIPVTVTPGAGTATVAGTYSPGGGVSVPFSRTLSLVPGLNVLQTTSTITNAGASAVTIRFFENYDPDQGIGQGAGFDTINTVKSLAGIQVSEATGPTRPLTAVLGAAGDIAAFGSGTSPFGLEVSNGTLLNQVFGTPFQPVGLDADIGFANGLEFTLAPGASASFTFFHAFGLTAAEAEAQFLAALPTAVPEPTTLALFGLGVLGVCGFRRRLR